MSRTVRFFIPNIRILLSFSLEPLKGAKFNYNENNDKTSKHIYVRLTQMAFRTQPIMSGLHLVPVTIKGACTR